MVGKFKSVRPSNNYCFIVGADGKDYFCHMKNLKDPEDRKYMWQGNECAFEVKPGDPGKNDEALQVIPDPVECPHKSARVSSKPEKKVKKKKGGLKTSSAVTAVYSYEKSGGVGSKYWGIVRDNEIYAVNKIPKVYGSQQVADEMLYFIHSEFSDAKSFRVHPVKVVRCGKMVYRVEYNGRVIYQGELEIFE